MYPLIRKDDRTLAKDYAGVVITCDVDKTYLDTDFKSAIGLMTIPLEWAEDKETVAGMGPVLKELRHGRRGLSQQVPFYFLTASPPMLLPVLYRKMLLDGVQCDGVTMKDWRSVLLKVRRPRWLKRQLAYKLSALLHQRSLLPSLAREILIGDDAESDALVYAIYADVLAGRITRDEVTATLEQQGFDDLEMEAVSQAIDRLRRPGDRVDRIYIYLATGRPPQTFDRFSETVVPCLSPFQLAVHLVLSDVVRNEAALSAARDLIRRGRADPASLTGELMEGVSRSVFDPEFLEPLHLRLHREGLVQPVDRYPEARATVGRRKHGRKARVSPPLENS